MDASRGVRHSPRYNSGECFCFICIYPREPTFLSLPLQTTTALGRRFSQNTRQNIKPKDSPNSVNNRPDYRRSRSQTHTNNPSQLDRDRPSGTRPRQVSQPVNPNSNSSRPRRATSGSTPPPTSWSSAGPSTLYTIPASSTEASNQSKSDVGTRASGGKSTNGNGDGDGDVGDNGGNGDTASPPRPDTRTQSKKSSDSSLTSSILHYRQPQSLQAAAEKLAAQDHLHESQATTTRKASSASSTRSGSPSSSRNSGRKFMQKMLGSGSSSSGVLRPPPSPSGGGASRLLFVSGDKVKPSKSFDKERIAPGKEKEREKEREGTQLRTSGSTIDISRPTLDRGMFAFLFRRITTCLLSLLGSVDEQDEPYIRFGSTYIHQTAKRQETQYRVRVSF